MLPLVQVWPMMASELNFFPCVKVRSGPWGDSGLVLLMPTSPSLHGHSSERLYCTGAQLVHGVLWALFLAAGLLLCRERS